jgi:glycosyltransferase involved in cell wall biosynthesis
MKILYPFRIDKPSPQATIAKEVGKRVNAEVYAYSSIERGIPKRITPIPIPASKYGKGLHYLASYLNDVDLVHTGPYTHNIFAPIAKIANRTQLVHTLHAVTGGRERDWLVQNADITTAVSQYIAQESGQHVDTVVPNGVSFDRFTPTAADRTDSIIYAGRLIEQKNAQLLPEIANLTDRRIDVFGDGKLRGRLEREAPENLHIHGHISRENLPEQYAAAAAMLCPYRDEGFGMTALEALASGTPVVGYRSGALPELIKDGLNGVLLDDVTPSEWVKGIERAVSCNQSVVRESVSQFHWDRIAERYEQIYIQIG